MTGTEGIIREMKEYGKCEKCRCNPCECSNVENFIHSNREVCNTKELKK